MAQISKLRVVALSEVVSSWFPGGVQAETGHNPSGLLLGRRYFPWEMVGGTRGPPAPPQVPPSQDSGLPSWP